MSRGTGIWSTDHGVRSAEPDHLREWPLSELIIELADYFLSDAGVFPHQYNVLRLGMRTDQ